MKFIPGRIYEHIDVVGLWEDSDGNIPAPAILKPRPIWTGKQVFCGGKREVLVGHFPKLESSTDQ
jgi:hypothetical protein